MTRLGAADRLTASLATLVQAHLPRHASAGAAGDRQRRQPAAGSDATAAAGQSRNFLSRFKQLFVALAVRWLCELCNLHELNYSKNKIRTDRRVVRNIDFV